MPVGLEVYDDKGRMIFDANTASRLTRIIGFIEASETNKKSGEIVIPDEYLVGNEIFYIMLESSVGKVSYNASLVHAEVQIIPGGIIRYSNIPCDFIYGVY